MISPADWQAFFVDRNQWLDFNEATTHSSFHYKNKEQVFNTNFIELVKKFLKVAVYGFKNPFEKYLPGHRFPNVQFANGINLVLEQTICSFLRYLFKSTVCYFYFKSTCLYLKFLDFIGSR